MPLGATFIGLRSAARMAFDQCAWMLRQLAITVPGLAATTQPRSRQRGGAQLLLAEAFITAAGKPEPLPAGQDTVDAAAAGLALPRSWTAPRRSPPVCAACCRTHSIRWRRRRYGPGCESAIVSCTPSCLSLPPVLNRSRHAHECRERSDDLVHFRTERIVGA
jgi:hypothetical protein